VIGLVEGQIVTETIALPVDAAAIPDLERDILKVTVCDRYRGEGAGVGLVHGFGLKEGALAASVSHDAHNIVAIGVSDAAIIAAVGAVIRNKGAMVAVSQAGTTVLPLPCGGLMATAPYGEVVAALDRLAEQTRSMGAIENPFMYLSFLALTVIPHLRITPRGVFDGDAFADVPLFQEEP